MAYPRGPGKDIFAAVQQVYATVDQKISWLTVLDYSVIVGLGISDAAHSSHQRSSKNRAS